MSFRFDIDELFNGDLSQYDSNDFSELNSVFQPGFNRSNSLYSSNNEQQLPLTTLTTTKLSMNLKNTDNGNSNDLDEQLRKRFQL
ncbi:hypothetical protein M0813_03735 [Anaeramoeba flamelloides]|uniref:Uncharacterized protein n=1 Tax=Anaeramoeba flamelloides TaxID=1746091 RepID=A0ABQ8XSK6_9EUKA|nr:hypothetical protein M0813_03735 [Anaeramoeba flamelloides]